MQLSAPGVKNTCEARQIGTYMTRVSGQLFDGLGRSLEQSLVGSPLMAAAKRSYLLRHSEGEHEMLTRQASAQLAFQPVPAFMVLALWTVAITTGSVDVMDLLATLAAIDRHTEITGSAIDYSINNLFVLFRQVGKSLKVFRGKSPEDIGDGTHDHTSLITELMI